MPCGAGACSKLSAASAPSTGRMRTRMGRSSRTTGARQFRRQKNQGQGSQHITHAKPAFDPAGQQQYGHRYGGTSQQPAGAAFLQLDDFVPALLQAREPGSARAAVLAGNTAASTLHATPAAIAPAIMRVRRCRARGWPMIPKIPSIDAATYRAASLARPAPGARPTASRPALYNRSR